MDIQIKNYTFYLTNACMLDCPYCYEKNKREKNGLYKMSQEDIDCIINFAKQNYDKNKISPNFSLFGGEPLFFLNDQVYYIIDKLKETFLNNDFSLSFMTNGYNLNNNLIKKLDGLNWRMLISLDGNSDQIKYPPKKILDKIINNILSVPKEIRRERLGVKATLSDETIENIKPIYEFLDSLETSIIYISPTHEIDPFRIKQAINALDEKSLKNMSDAKFLLTKNKNSASEGVELFFLKGKIYLKSRIYNNLNDRPIGWFKNGKIVVSELLLKNFLNEYPGFFYNQLYLTPYNSSKCESCYLKENNLCIPNLKKINNHVSKTQCLWYTTIKEKIDELS